MTFHRSLPKLPARPSTYSAVYVQNGCARGNEHTILEVAEFVAECHRLSCSVQEVSAGRIGISGVHVSLVKRPDDDVVCAYHDCPSGRIRRGDLERSAVSAGRDDKSLGGVVEPIVIGVGPRSDGEPASLIFIGAPSYKQSTHQFPLV